MPRFAPFRWTLAIFVATSLGAALGVSAQAATVNWVPVGPPGAPWVTALTIAKPAYSFSFPQRPSPLYAATASGVLRSGDAGGTWTGTGPGLTGDAMAIAVRQVLHMGVDSGTYDTTVFAGTSGAGIFRLPSGAASWVAANTGLAALDVKALAVSGDGVVRSGNAGVVFAGTSDGLFASTDEGVTWVRKTAGLPTPSPTIRALATDPSSPKTLYAGTSEGLFKSVDTGETWSLLDTAPGYILDVSTVEVDPLVPTRLYASGIKTVPCNPFCPPIPLMPVILQSPDGGATWVETNVFPYFAVVSALAATPTLPTRVFVATPNSGIFESDDAGVTWAPASSGLDTASVTSLAIDPSSPSSIFAGTAKGVYRAALGQVSAGCTPNLPTVLCLDSNRFSVEVRWTATNIGQSGFGQEIPLTAETGAFWFFQPSNIELVVKVLDARAINGKFWVFYGALTNVGFTLTVIDQQTGEVRTYVNPEGQLASFADTSAF